MVYSINYKRKKNLWRWANGSSFDKKSFNKQPKAKPGVGGARVVEMVAHAPCNTSGGPARAPLCALRRRERAASRPEPRP